MKNTRTIKWILCLCCLLAALFTFTLAAHAEIVDSGTCGAEGDGSNLTWTLDDKGTLTISGSGAMKNYDIKSPFFNLNKRIQIVVIKNGVTSIGSFSFYCNDNITSITIPSSVSSIGRYAFYSCKNIKSVTIPKGVEQILQGAFSDCTNLKKVTMPEGLRYIGWSAFQDCIALNGVTIPNSVTSIGEYAFLGCKGLTSLTIPDNVTNVDGFAFSGCNNIKTVYISKNLQLINYNMFSYCSSLETIKIPDSVTTIASFAFNECSKLTSITIPDSVKQIQEKAFQKCWNLQDVYFGGDAEAWEKINIDKSGNEYLLNATIHFAGEGNSLIAAEIILPTDFFYFNNTLYDITGTEINAITATLQLRNTPEEGTQGKTLQNITATCTLTNGGVFFQNNATTYSCAVDSLSPNEIKEIPVSISFKGSTDFLKNKSLWKKTIALYAVCDGISSMAQTDFNIYPVGGLKVNFHPDKDYSFKNGSICVGNEKASFIEGTLNVKYCAPDGFAGSLPDSLAQKLDKLTIAVDGELGLKTGMTFADGTMRGSDTVVVAYGEAAELQYAFTLNESELALKCFQPDSPDLEETIRFSLTCDNAAFEPIETEETIPFHYDTSFIKAHMTSWDNVVKMHEEKSFSHNTSVDSEVKLGACKIWAALGDIGKLASLSIDGYKTNMNYFDAYVADILLKFINNDLPEALEKKATVAFDKYHEWYGYFSDGMKTMEEWKESVDKTTEIDLLKFFKFDDYTPSKRSTQLLLNMCFSDSNFKQKVAPLFYQMGCAANTVDQVCNKIKSATDTINAFREVYNAVVLANAYRDVMDEFYIILEDSAERMKDIDKDYAAEFMKSVAKAKSKAYLDVSSVVSELLSCGEPLAKLVYNQLGKTALKGFLYHQIAKVCGLDVTGSVAAAIFAYKTTYSILDQFLKVGDLTEQYEIMNHVSPIEFSLYSQVISTYRNMLNNLTYDSAVTYDAAVRLWKQTNIYLYDAAYKFTKANVLHNALDAITKKDYSDEMDTIASYKNDWESFSCHNETVHNMSYKKVTVKCPVDVFVYIGADSLAASIVNEEIETQADNITILIAEGEKTVIYPSTEPYTVKVTARESGEMTYCVTELSDVTVLRRVKTENIPLQAGQTFEARLPTEADGIKEGYALHTNGTELAVTSDEKVEQPAVLPGDVDGNGKVESADARLALRASVKLEREITAGTVKFAAADYDGNGKVESSDARAILRVSVKLDPFG